MLTITITTVPTFTVASRGKEVTVDLAKLPTDILAKAALHGIKQKIADAAAGAAKASFRDKAEGESADAWAKAFAVFKDEDVNAPAIAAKGLALMQKALDKLVAGDWTADRESAESMSKLDIIMADTFIAGAKLAQDKKVSIGKRRADALAELAKRPADTQAKVRAYAEKVLAAALDVPVF